MKTTDFTKGMTIYASDNTPLGDVVEVWAETSSHGCLPLSRHLLQDYGPIKGTYDLLSTENGYLQVRQGAFLGSGGRDLSIPIQSVLQIEHRVSAPLHLPTAACETLFETRPNVLAAVA